MGNGWSCHRRTSYPGGMSAALRLYTGNNEYYVSHSHLNVEIISYLSDVKICDL